LPTSTPSLESNAQEIIERIVVGEIGTVNITVVGSPKLLAVDYEMSGLLDYDLDFSGTEMLRLACELFAAGFNNDWRFQFAAMIQLVDTSTGQTSQDEGLLGRVTSNTVSTWNCENVYSMNPELALDEYRVNPLMNR
ncbi:MAG: hypothetical protein JNM70_11270, partial [Anaerolineae bacterium]|nr:hypothetical protein [Anaerolineae bacterium]